MNVSKAITQSYRENAKYLDRIYKWMGKVGLDWVREQTVDDLANRAAFVAQFELSQRFTALILGPSMSRKSLSAPC